VLRERLAAVSHNDVAGGSEIHGDKVFLRGRALVRVVRRFAPKIERDAIGEALVKFGHLPQQVGKTSCRVVLAFLPRRRDHVVKHVLGI